MAAFPLDIRQQDASGSCRLSRGVGNAMATVGKIDGAGAKSETGLFSWQRPPASVRFFEDLGRMPDHRYSSPRSCLTSARGEPRTPHALSAALFTATPFSVRRHLRFPDCAVSVQLPGCSRVPSPVLS